MGHQFNGSDQGHTYVPYKLKTCYGVVGLARGVDVWCGGEGQCRQRCCVTSKVWHAFSCKDSCTATAPNSVRRVSLYGTTRHYLGIYYTHTANGGPETQGKESLTAGSAESTHEQGQQARARMCVALAGRGSRL